MSKSIFIAGTGLSVGKTYISALLIKKLMQGGLKAGYYKPVQIGAVNLDGRLVAGDPLRVSKECGLYEDPNSMSSYLYQSAVPPHLASRIEGPPIEIETIKKDFEKALRSHEYLTVDGYGGLFCPFRRDDKENWFQTDLIHALGLGVLLVSSAALGTLNSTILSVEHARSRKIDIRGIILDNYQEGSILHKDNRKVIEEVTGVPVLACVGNNSQELNIPMNCILDLYRKPEPFQQ